ncbi:MAG: hypothetical protein JRH06_03050 [Deltaproteobacteria bacterium]|nr:hypothetical protein [Deltaproteobacteria bacterium]MBW2136516.1 hypothetical protein [Deltaproteobacteria bacterium]
MDMIEKAKIRLEHWMEHNSHHLEDYEEFAADLEAAGRKESAEYIRQVAALTAKTNELMKKALNSLSNV